MAGSDVSGEAAWPRPARYRPQPLGPATQQLDLLVDTLQGGSSRRPSGSGGGRRRSHREQ